MKLKQNKGKSNSKSKSVQFIDLFKLEEIQNLQDLFSDSCGVASIITFPDGKPITKPSNFCTLCSDIIRKTAKGLANCQKSDSVLGQNNSTGPVVQPCLSGGLWDAGASITVGGVHVANWLIGQVRNSEIDEKGMLQYANEIGANQNDFLKALKEVPVMSEEQFNKVSKMLYAFAGELSEKAYRNLLLKQQIEERNQAESALQENEKKFRNIFENAQEGIFQTTVDGSYVSVNPALAKMYGFASPEELISSRTDISKDAYMDPKERDVFLKLMEDQGFVKGYEYEVKDKNGKRLWFYEDAQAIKDETGKVKYFEGFVVDITERKKAELKLLESEERYKRITAGITDYLYTVEVRNGKAIETHHSEACLTVTGYTSEELISDPYLWINMVVPEERVSVAGRFLQILEGNDLPAFEHRIIHKDGKIRWISDQAIPKYNPNGKLVSYDGIIKDITERKQVEEALRENEEKLSTLFISMTEMVALHELVFGETGEVINYRITDCNNAFTSITGINKENAIGKLATEVYGTQTPPYLKEFSNVAITGKSFEYNTYFEPMDKHFMISVVSPKKNHFATITTDISAIQQIQEVITTKNKELENYLYVASHDLRSPLVNIQGFSQRLQKQANAINTFVADANLDNETQMVLNKITKEDIPKTLSFIYSNVTKMDSLINGLLQISRTGRIKVSIAQINMNQLIKTIISALNFQIAEISGEVQVENLSDCYGDENQLNQLFSNIIGNALKYRDKKRKMVIKIGCTIQFNKVVYSIQDTGIGIAQRHLERIWDIFYRVDSGSPIAGEGIGLSLAKRITEKHKGKIWAESVEETGSIFYIELQKRPFSE